MITIFSLKIYAPRRQFPGMGNILREYSTARILTTPPPQFLKELWSTPPAHTPLALIPLESAPQLKKMPELRKMLQLDVFMPIYIQGKIKSYLIAEASIKHYILHCISTQTHNILYTVKVKTQQFIKRKSNLIKKADQLVWLCHTDFALIIHKNYRYYTYQLNNHDYWSFMIIKIVCETEHKLLIHWQNCRKNHTLCQSICFPKILTITTMTAHQIQRRSHHKQSLNWHM